MAVAGCLWAGKGEVGKTSCRHCWIIASQAVSFRLSAFAGKTDGIQGVAECPLIANSGHERLYRNEVISVPRPDQFRDDGAPAFV